MCTAQYQANGRNRNLTLTENSQNFATVKTMTNLTDSGNNTELADACRAYVPISQSGFFALAITLMVLALYTIVESIIMLCNVCGNCQIRTPSDWLLFDQEYLPDKVL